MANNLVGCQIEPTIKTRFVCWPIIVHGNGKDETICWIQIDSSSKGTKLNNTNHGFQVTKMANQNDQMGGKISL
jgi:hypothetical protein